MSDNFTEHGLFHVALSLAFSAIKHNDEAFFREDFGSNIMYIIELKTGLTLSVLKDLYNSKYNILENKVNLLNDASNLTVPQLSDKYNISEETVRNILYKANVKPKSMGKKTDEDLIKEILLLKGLHTITDISNITHTSFSRAKKICIREKIPYKETV